MKRIAVIFLTILFVAVTLTACGGNLSSPKNGTYKSDEGFLSQT